MQDQDNDSVDISNDEFSAAVSPSDLRGRLNIRIENSLQKEIENIAEDSRYPLKSSSEVVRYCCMIGLQRLRRWKPGPTLLGSIRTANALMVRDKLQCESLELIQRLDERVNWYIAHKYYDEVIDLVACVRSYFDGLPEDFWNEYIKREIDTRFVQWMDRIDDERNRNGK